MSEQLYRIKPLEWEGNDPKLEGDKVRVTTIFGSMYVGYTMLPHEGEYYLPGEHWVWGYCFDEYYDEAEHDCDSLEDGKAKAEAHYRERLLAALEPVEQEQR